jgi:hypothetical protein
MMQLCHHPAWPSARLLLLPPFTPYRVGLLRMERTPTTITLCPMLLPPKATLPAPGPTLSKLGSLISNTGVYQSLLCGADPLRSPPLHHSPLLPYPPTPPHRTTQPQYWQPQEPPNSFRSSPSSSSHLPPYRQDCRTHHPSAPWQPNAPNYGHNQR